jgi:hypothetical protein
MKPVAASRVWQRAPADGGQERCHALELMVLEGNGVRFIDGVEGMHVLRVGSRVGMLLPATGATATPGSSGGRGPAQHRRR